MIRFVRNSKMDHSFSILHISISLPLLEKKRKKKKLDFLWNKVGAGEQSMAAWRSSHSTCSGVVKNKHTDFCLFLCCQSEESDLISEII